MIITPCEIAVKDILPAIRALIVRELYNMGLKQKEIASKLNLTQPAVSYYLNQRRAKKVRMFEGDEQLMKIVRELANEIIENRASWKELKERFCQMCKIAQVRVFGFAFD